ncbi:MAG: enoyl-CoA hydratase/isomerase family protein [Archangiaceae bacterium]|nr:enoyl-CoA hydratase/isomerase family protein [Archangiaceae bacterium]
MTEPVVLTRRDGRAGRITLNRPKALHALDTTMCQLMTDALVAWRADAAVELIVIDHSGERGFCAGGDLRMMAESGRSDGAEASRFFLTEYRLNHLLQAYPKPIVAVLDGVTMGGGVGISVHGSHRVATERTVFAMPETAIGLFPEVGGGWFLPRLEREVGTWLALTGARIKGLETLSVGVATHFTDSSDITALEQRLSDRGIDAMKGLTMRGPRMPHHDGALVPLFGHDTIDAVLHALETRGDDWPREQARVIRSRSPQSLAVTMEQLRRGRVATRFEDVMAMEFRLATRMVRTHDFQEGVRAVIVEKDNAPKWSNAPVDLQGLFAPLPDGEWTPLV